MALEVDHEERLICRPFHGNELYAQGFLPSAMKNYLSLLGWNDGTEKEIFSEQELFEAFDLRRVVKSAAVFDMTKLK